MITIAGASVEERDYHQNATSSGAMVGHLPVKRLIGWFS